MAEKAELKREAQVGKYVEQTLNKKLLEDCETLINIHCDSKPVAYASWHGLEVRLRRALS